jgi:hypothetical protein
MRAAWVVVLFCICGSLAGESPVDSHCRFFLYLDPTALWRMETGVQAVGLGWASDSLRLTCNKSRRLRVLEFRFSHWYFDRKEKNYGSLMADSMNAPGAFHAIGLQITVERIIPFSLFYPPFLPSFWHEVGKNGLNGCVFGFSPLGATLYIPEDSWKGTDYFGNASLFVGIQQSVPHDFFFGVRGGYALEYALARLPHFVKDRPLWPPKSFFSIVIGKLF